MRSYLEILNELRTAVESEYWTDVISDAEKRELYFHIDELKELLWKYSD